VIKHALALALLCALLAGCDDSTPPEPTPSDTSDDVVLCPEADDCGLGQDTTAPEDVAPGPEDVAVPEPLFELGTNITGANTPDSFSPLIDGDSLNIELGFQGLWMIVLAFRTREIFEGKLTIIARVTVGDEQQGELGLAKQKLIPGGNDLDYYYNLFLVVMEPSVTGSTATIKVTVEDSHGAFIEENRLIQLIGGASP
jgi:hypothetical protein